MTLVTQHYRVHVTKHSWCEYAWLFSGISYRKELPPDRSQLGLRMSIGKDNEGRKLLGKENLLLTKVDLKAKSMSQWKGTGMTLG